MQCAFRAKAAGDSVGIGRSAVAEGREPRMIEAELTKPRQAALHKPLLLMRGRDQISAVDQRLAVNSG